jgi:hypothetical protein
MPIFSKADPSTTNISFSPSTLTCGPAPTPACQCSRQTARTLMALL